MLMTSHPLSVRDLNGNPQFTLIHSVIESPNQSISRTCISAGKRIAGRGLAIYSYTKSRVIAAGLAERKCDASGIYYTRSKCVGTLWQKKFINAIIYFGVSKSIRLVFYVPLKNNQVPIQSALLVAE